MSEAHSVTDDDIKELMRKVKNERQLEHIQAEIAKSSKDGETQLTKMKRLELWLAAQNRNDERVPFPDLPQCEPLATDPSRFGASSRWPSRDRASDGTEAMRTVE